MIRFLASLRIFLASLFLLFLALAIDPSPAAADPLPPPGPVVKVDAGVRPPQVVQVQQPAPAVKTPLPTPDGDPLAFAAAAEKAANDASSGDAAARRRAVGLLVALLLVGLAFAARRFLPLARWPWMHGREAHIAIPLAAGLTTAAERLWAGDAWLVVIVGGVVEVAFAAFAMAYPVKQQKQGEGTATPPSTSAATPPPPPGPLQAAGWLLPLLFCASLLGTGCGYCKVQANVQTPRCQLQASSISCGKALGAAMLTAVESTKLWTALISNGTNWVADVLAVAAAIGPGGWEAVVCELSAIRAYLAALVGLPASSPLSTLAPALMTKIDAVLKLEMRTILNVAAAPAAPAPVPAAATP